MKEYWMVREKDASDDCMGLRIEECQHYYFQAKDDSELLDRFISLFPQDVKEGYGIIYQEMN